jgi:hypothetical protein
VGLPKFSTLIFNLWNFKATMPETFGQKMGAIAAILILILIFTGIGIAMSPDLAQLFEFFAILDIVLLLLFTGVTVVVELKGRLVG